MRDPHIHAEKMPMPGFGHAAIRDLIATGLGIAADLPKTVGTGCGRRRPIAMTSIVPEHVTCLACREYAHGEHLKWAEMADAAASLELAATGRASRTRGIPASNARPAPVSTERWPNATPGRHLND